MTRSSQSQTLPSSPSFQSHSQSSSSEFEFSVSVSPRANSCSAAPCPADELFYKGQLLPLQLSPRLSMVRTILLASSSTSGPLMAAKLEEDYRETSTTNSRDSTASSSDRYCTTDSSSSGRPSSVVDEEYRFLGPSPSLSKKYFHKYFSLSRISSVFKRSKEGRSRASAKEVVRKCLKKVKPLYEMIGKNGCAKKEASPLNVFRVGERGTGGYFSLSFSGNLSFPIARKGHASSCPSSMLSSPSHSGLLCRKSTDGVGGRVSGGSNTYLGSDTLSSMEEVQNAIQGAIAHCKNSLLQKRDETEASQ